MQCKTASIGILVLLSSMLAFLSPSTSALTLEEALEAIPEIPEAKLEPSAGVNAEADLSLIVVKASQGWQSTGIKVRPGQKITLSASGMWTADKRVPDEIERTVFNWTGPEGNPELKDWEQCAGNYCGPIMTLLGKIGDNVFEVGALSTHDVNNDGTLYLAPNDLCCLEDNDGDMKVSVVVE